MIFSYDTNQGATDRPDGSLSRQPLAPDRSRVTSRTRSPAVDPRPGWGGRGRVGRRGRDAVRRRRQGLLLRRRVGTQIGFPRLPDRGSAPVSSSSPLGKRCMIARRSRPETSPSFTPALAASGTHRSPARGRTRPPCGGYREHRDQGIARAEPGRGTHGPLPPRRRARRDPGLDGQRRGGCCLRENKKKMATRLGGQISRPASTWSLLMGLS